MMVNMHLAQIYAPALQFTFYGSFAGVNLTEGGGHHWVLIGRDFLRHFHLSYDGPSGEVTLFDPHAPLAHEPPDE